MSQFAVYRVKDQTKAPWQLSYFEVLEQKIPIREQDYQQIYLKHQLKLILLIKHIIFQHIFQKVV